MSNVSLSQARTLSAIRALHTSSNANAGLKSQSNARNTVANRAMDSSDLFFACDDQSASSAAKDLRFVSVALDSFLAKAGSNFEVEITFTRMSTMPPVEVYEGAEAMSYKFNLLLARGASFSN